ncbi:MAG: DinB family protein [Thermomicrobiales bacterium]
MDPTVAEITAGFKAVHQSLREEIAALDAAELNWKPAPETNSIAALVVHTLGSEAEVFRISAAVPAPRDRDAEFLAKAETAAQLLPLLDAADALLDDLAPRVTSEMLPIVRARGNRPSQTALYWLLNNYGHAREHLGHIQLTRQIYAARG